MRIRYQVDLPKNGRNFRITSGRSLKKRGDLQPRSGGRRQRRRPACCTISANVRMSSMSISSDLRPAKRDCAAPTTRRQALGLLKRNTVSQLVVYWPISLRAIMRVYPIGRN